MDALRLALQVTLICALLSGLPAAAQPPTGDAETRAAAAFDEGQTRFDEGDYDAALSAFRRAFELLPNPIVRHNIAVCLERMDQFRASMLEYESIAAAAEMGSDERLEALANARRLSALLGEISVTGQAGAHVAIDGEETCVVPCRSQADPGYREVRVTFGASVIEDRVAVRRGETTTVSATFLEEPRPPDPIPPENTDETNRGPSLGLMVAGASLFAVGTAGAIAFGVHTAALKDRFDAGGRMDDGLASDGTLFRTLAWTMGGVAVVGAVLVIIGLLVSD